MYRLALIAKRSIYLVTFVTVFSLMTLKTERVNADPSPTSGSIAVRESSNSDVVEQLKQATQELLDAIIRSLRIS